MVDYSKWDKLDVSSDDEGETARRPTVTRLDQPSTVHFGNATADAPAASASRSESWARNGLDCGDLVWSQTGDAVLVRVRVPAGTKARQIRVTVLPDRVTVMLDSRVHCDIALKNPVDASDELVEGCWELVDEPGATGRAVSISLRKKVQVQGFVHWWAQLRPSDAPIDVTTLQDRRAPGESFAAVWEEAHKIFKERVATRKPTEIEIDDDDDDAEVQSDKIDA